MICRTNFGKELSGKEIEDRNQQREDVMRQQCIGTVGSTNE